LVVGSICKFLASQWNPTYPEAVRGSPLLRFFVLTIALAATGLGLMRVTSVEKTPKPVLPAEPAAVPAQAVPFRLILSSPASFVEIDSGTKVSPPVTDGTLSGKLEMDPENPYVGIIIRWKNPIAPGEHRFAKIILEPPGKATFTHTFDAAGDLEDFIELPGPTVP
jgi:hypothetical protein